MDLSYFFSHIKIFLLEYPSLSPTLFVLFHIVFAVCLLPCSPMGLIAGALWGKWLGLGLAILAAFLSSCVTFGLSRLFLKRRIHSFLCKKYAKTDWFLDQTKKHGWKFVASVYLNPVAPGAALGYLFGLTRIDFKLYCSLILLFMLPLQIILVMLGDTFSTTLIHQSYWLIFTIFFALMGAYISYQYIIKKKKVSLEL